MVLPFDDISYLEQLEGAGVDEALRLNIQCELSARRRLATLEAQRATLEGELHGVETESKLIETTLQALHDWRHDRAHFTHEEIMRVYNARDRAFDEQQASRATKKRRRPG